jgi:hypothetical protein
VKCPLPFLKWSLGKTKQGAPETEISSLVAKQMQVSLLSRWVSSSKFSCPFARVRIRLSELLALERRRCRV